MCNNKYVACIELAWRRLKLPWCVRRRIVTRFQTRQPHDTRHTNQLCPGVCVPTRAATGGGFESKGFTSAENPIFLPSTNQEQPNAPKIDPLCLFSCQLPTLSNSDQSNQLRKTLAET